mmetsp:Transcript_34339/g.34909  ORF Transcript_34339/g.34909 Transcript_34339/m.34909 type:complete len:136 (-) Transcript_34339:370-777(-)
MVVVVVVVGVGVVADAAINIAVTVTNAAGFVAFHAFSVEGAICRSDAVIVNFYSYVIVVVAEEDSSIVIHAIVVDAVGITVSWNSLDIVFPGFVLEHYQLRAILILSLWEQSLRIQISPAHALLEAGNQRSISTI